MKSPLHFAAALSAIFAGCVNIQHTGPPADWPRMPRVRRGEAPVAAPNRKKQGPSRRASRSETIVGVSSLENHALCPLVFFGRSYAIGVDLRSQAHVVKKRGGDYRQMNSMSSTEMSKLTEGRLT